MNDRRSLARPIWILAQHLGTVRPTSTCNRHLCALLAPATTGAVAPSGNLRTPPYRHLDARPAESESVNAMTLDSTAPLLAAEWRNAYAQAPRQRIITTPTRARAFSPHAESGRIPTARRTSSSQSRRQPAADDADTNVHFLIPKDTPEGRARVTRAISAKMTEIGCRFLASGPQRKV